MRHVTRYPAKPIARGDHLSMLLPTRGRPDGVRALFANLQATVADKERFDVWLFVDDDDEVTLDYIASGEWRDHDFPINWHVAPCKNSMGEMYNELWQCSTSHAGIYFPFLDDYVISTQGWDETVRRSFRGSPDGLLLGYVIDPTAQRFQVTIPILSAQWLNIIGYFISDRFYYWFGDQWLDEIAQMVDRKALVPIRVHAPGGKGKTPRMRNLPFWCGYFFNTLEERFLEACQILEERHGSDSEGLARARRRAMGVAATLMHKSYAVDYQEIKQDEQRYRDFDKVPRPTQVASYLVSECQAVEELLGRVRSASDAGKPADLIEILETLELSTFSVPDLDYLKAEALHRLGYRDQALESLRRELELRPDEPKGARLLEAVRASHPSPGCHEKERSVLRMPSWITLEDPVSLLLPESIDLDLYFTLQRLVYDDADILTVLDVGAGSGEGSTRALVEAAVHAPRLRIFCIEPDGERFAALRARHPQKAILLQAASVPPERYLAPMELELFYRHIPSVLNAVPLEELKAQLKDETARIAQWGIPTDGIARIKREHRIERFDLAVLDGSLFCGPADLREAYGARYLVLNSVRSIKNYANFKYLIDDGNYRVMAANLKSGCGYAVFQLN